MDTPLFVSNQLTIDAPAKMVWTALTEPEYTRQYMFGTEPVTDWKPGSPLLWKGIFNGAELVAVKGHIVSIEPAHSLVYTVIDPNNPAIPDIPENYLTVTIRLTEEGNKTHVFTSMGDYNKVAEGESRYRHTVDGGGWSSILEQIKQLVEK